MNADPVLLQFNWFPFYFLLNWYMN